MSDFILFMHDDAPASSANSDAAWASYFAALRSTGAFQGGSAIGDGVCVSKTAQQRGIAGHITGYIRVSAENLEAARALIPGNPVFEAGGTVEIRELPESV